DRGSAPSFPSHSRSLIGTVRRPHHGFSAVYTIGGWVVAHHIATDQSGAIEKATIRRITRRLLPFLVLLYFLNFLDRVNVSFAALQMNADLGMSQAAYGFGAGLFFIGYFIFEVPSNMILHKVGARIWIARIAVTWGAVSAGTAFIQTEAHF